MRRGSIIYFFRRALSVSGAPRPSASASSLLSLAWKTRENKTCFHAGCARPRQTWRSRGRIAHKLSLQNFLDREARAKRRESGRVAYHSLPFALGVLPEPEMRSEGLWESLASRMLELDGEDWWMTWREAKAKSLPKTESYGEQAVVKGLCSF